MFFTQNYVFMVMELASGGDLFDHIVRGHGVSESEAGHYFLQLLDGVEYCHMHNIVHRDLKPENVLLDSNQSVKICDFGFSKCIPVQATGGNAMCHTVVGTELYCAPEVLRRVPYDGKLADIWSLGVILFALISGCLPVDHPSTADEKFRRLSKGQLNYRPWEMFSGPVKECLIGLLQVTPEKRMPLQAVRKSAFLRNIRPAAPMVPEPLIVPPSPLSALDSLKSTVSSSYPNTPIPFSNQSCASNILDISEAGVIGRDARSVDSMETDGTETDDDMPDSAYSSTSVGGAAIFLSAAAAVALQLPEFHDMVFTSSRFTSTVPPQELLKQVCHTLSAMSIAYACKRDAFRVKVEEQRWDDCSVAFRVQLYQKDASTQLVEFRRGNCGNIEFGRFFNAFMGHYTLRYKRKE
jgi:serine/threonine protein kinase